MRNKLRSLLAGLLLLLLPVAASAAVMQSPEDRADPSVVEQELHRQDRPDKRGAGATVIEPGRTVETSTPAGFVVGAIRVEGAVALPASAFVQVVDAYVGRELSTSDMRSLASDVANVARRRGYGLAAAWIPEQQVLNGVLRVRIDEGRIDRIDAEGSGDKAVERMLRPLVDGRPVRTQALERRILLAGDVHGVRLHRVRLDRTAAGNVLRIEVGRERVEGRAFLDNWGSDISGPLRARLTINVNGLLADDDRLTVGGVVTPTQPRELALVSAAYAKGLGPSGTQIQVNGYHARSHAGGVLRDRDFEGRSTYAEIGLNHPLKRSRSASLWAHLSLGRLDAAQTQRGAMVRDDHLTTAEASLYGNFGNNRQRLRIRLAARQGLDLLDASRAGDAKLSRRDASGIFSKLEFWAAYDRSLGGNFALGLQAQGQIASRPLLASEEMGLGGRSFLRGYDYREHSGDKGIAGSVELRYDLARLPKPLRSVQFYLYGDAGTVGNYRGGFGSGRLASAGGGMRLGVSRNFEGGIEIGVPLRRGALADEDYGPRLSFTLASRF